MPTATAQRAATPNAPTEEDKKKPAGPPINNVTGGPENATTGVPIMLGPSVPSGATSPSAGATSGKSGAVTGAATVKQPVKRATVPPVKKAGNSTGSKAGTNSTNGATDIENGNLTAATLNAFQQGEATQAAADQNTTAGTTDTGSTNTGSTNTASSGILGSISSSPLLKWGIVAAIVAGGIFIYRRNKSGEKIFSRGA